MPDPAEEYRRAIVTARNQVLNPRGVPKEAYQGLMQLYARMISDINRDLGREVITAERGEQLENLLIRRFNDLGDDIGVLFEKQRRSVAEVAANGHAEAVNRATSAANVSGISVSFNGIPDQALEAMMLRRGINSRNYQSVIKRGLQSIAPDIDQYLTSAVGRGISGDRAAKELAGILSRGNDDVLQLVDDGRLTKSSINKALREGDIDVMTYNRASKVLNDSRRIMITEINTAHRESDLLSQARSPIVGASKWQVSGRHYGLPSSPDVCLRKGTPVITDEGSKAIEDIEIGDKVLTHKDRFKPVTRLYRRTIPAGTIQKLRFQAGQSQPKEVIMTPNHPVLTDQGWIPAGALQKDMTLRSVPPESELWQNQPAYDTLHKEGLGCGQSYKNAYAQNENAGLCDGYHQHHFRNHSNHSHSDPMPTGQHAYRKSEGNYPSCHQHSLGYSLLSAFQKALTACQQASSINQDVEAHSSDCHRFSSVLDNLLPCIQKNSRFDWSSLDAETLCRILDKCFQSDRRRTGIHGSKKKIALQQMVFVYRFLHSSCTQEKLHSGTLQGCFDDIHSHIHESKTPVFCNDSFLCSCQEALHNSCNACLASLFCDLLPNICDCNNHDAGLLDHRGVPHQLVQEALHSIYSSSSIRNLSKDVFNYSNLPKTRIISNEAVKTGGETVYNIEVKDDNSYTANGLVVHNCTMYHEADQFGLGAGVFPTKNVPSTPHPYCGCSNSPVIIEDPENWGSGGAALREPSDLRGEQFQSMFSDKTDRHLERQLEVANKYQRLAYQVAQGFGDQAA